MPQRSEPGHAPTSLRRSNLSKQACPLANYGLIFPPEGSTKVPRASRLGPVLPTTVQPSPHMQELYLVEESIPEIEARPGDIIVDDPEDGLCLVRDLDTSRQVLVFRSRSLRRLASPFSRVRQSLLRALPSGQS